MIRAIDLPPHSARIPLMFNPDNDCIPHRSRGRSPEPPVGAR